MIFAFALIGIEPTISDILITIPECMRVWCGRGVSEDMVLISEKRFTKDLDL